MTSVPAPMRSPARARLDELLADGEWHAIAEAMAVVGAAVAPGVAFRAGERLRHNRLVDGSVANGERTRGDEATAVAAGRRSKARDVLHQAVRRGSVERDGDRLRRVPDEALTAHSQQKHSP